MNKLASDSYRSSGVDLDFMDGLKERIKASAALTHGPEVLSSGGSFAGLYQLSGYDQPVLVASTDGVGTKLKIAAHLDQFESIGIDLVTLNVNDILTQGAKPLFFLDYIAFSNLDEEHMENLVLGITQGCQAVGCALISGETAQMPGVYSSGDFDLAGFVVGVVEHDRLVSDRNVSCGDVLVGIPSSGLHTNGFSMVRQVFNIDDEPSVLFQHFPGLPHALGEELMTRHQCYYPMLEPVLGLVKGLAHITGGGLPGKIPAVLSDGLAAAFQLGSWQVPPIFDVIQIEGSIITEEMYRVFNMGLGMVAICAEENLVAFQESVPGSSLVGRIIHREGDAQVLFENP